MGSFSGYEWLVIALIILLLFGARRLPDLARSMGRSMRIFKSEIKDQGLSGPAEAPDDASAQRPTAATDDDGGRPST